MNRARIGLGVVLLGLIVEGCGRKEPPQAEAPVPDPAVTPAAAAPPTAKDVPQPAPAAKARTPAPRVPTAGTGKARSRHHEYSLVNDVVQTSLAGAALKADDRAPMTEKERTPRGVRFTCNQRGNRFRLEVAGSQIDEANMPLGLASWRVDGSLFGVVCTSRPLDVKPDETRIVRQRREELIAECQPLGFRFAAESLEVLKFPTGERAEVWAMVPDAATQAKSAYTHILCAVTLNRNNVVELICNCPRGFDERRCGATLRQALLSLERLPDLPPDRVPMTVEDMARDGYTFKQTLWINSFSAPSGALLNADLASPSDRRLERTAVVEAEQLVRLAGLYVMCGPLSNPEVAKKTQDPLLTLAVIQCCVCDGVGSHIVGLHTFVGSLQRYVYIDPWGDDTFLAEGNNKAGVAAQEIDQNAEPWRPYAGLLSGLAVEPDRPLFSIKPSELQKVLYALITSWEALQRLRQLDDVLGQPEDEAIAACRAIHAAEPTNPMTTAKALLGAGRFYLANHEPKRAMTAFCVCGSLHPDEPGFPEGWAEADKALKK